MTEPTNTRPTIASVDAGLREALIAELWESDAASALNNRAARMLEADTAILSTLDAREAEVARLWDLHQTLHMEKEEADARIAELEAKAARTMSDHGRMLWQDDVTGICASTESCFDHGGPVRCSPCANKQAIAHGIAPDLSPPYSPEVCRLKRELDAREARIATLEAALEQVKKWAEPRDSAYQIATAALGATNAR